VQLALVDAPSLTGPDGRPVERTGIRVMVGGRAVHTIELDTGARQVVAGAAGPNSTVQDLVAAGPDVFGVRRACGGRYEDVVPLLRIRAGRAAVTGRASGLVSVAGTDRVWFYRNPAYPTAPVPLWRADGTGTRMRLVPGLWPVADTPAGLLADVTFDDLTSQERSAVGVADPRTGGVRHLIGAGWPLAVHPSFVITADNACHQAATCALVALRLADGRVLRTVDLPTGRQPTGGGTLSPDGRWLAFGLSRSEPDRRYDAGHPGPPSDIAVVDLGSGALTVLPGISLPAKSTAGLVFSRDSRWLVVALGAGRWTRLLVWRPGWDRPREAPAAAPASSPGQVPIVLAPDG
jgi:hypothetical protein